ncbi:class I SAM-dependent methyltransferase [uncultured Pontibacter sp.]|uniref:class I SAM-dependent methyltransferase n=1 Tax=uncultured Pontibacter sp. TaxID=453356 RepID=UPI002623843E|nr:class I SAM-dependent methyltransferase [uncultured Pontibacter sp.]
METFIRTHVISPLTGKNNVEKIKSYNIVQIIEKWKLLYKIDVTDEFNSCIETELTLYKCLDTELLFFEPKVEGTPFLYKELQNNFFWYYLESKWEYEVALNEISNIDKCIEIGCGSGTFVKKALELDKRIIGIETSKDAVEKAAKNNLPVYLMDINEALKYLKGKPDAILAFQVLEHISDPLSFLTSLINNLNNDGKLILCVPNANCFYKYEDDLLDMPPHHQTRWSLETFQSLQNILPIKLIDVKYEPLSHLHINSWINANSNHYRRTKWYGRLLFNKISIPIINKLLHTKARSLLRGHTIYVSFIKTN